MSESLPRTKKITSFDNVLFRSPKILDDKLVNSTDAELILPTTAGTIALTSDITTATTGAVSESGTQTLTNKTLTEPTIATIKNGEGVVITIPTVSGTLALNADVETLSARFERLLSYLEDWIGTGNINMDDVKTYVNSTQN